MKSSIFTKKTFLAGIIHWWFVFVILSITKTNTLQVLNIVGFLSLVLIPGILTILVLHIRNLQPWGYIGVAIGFSLLELYIVALFGNVVLPFLGVARPIGQNYLLAEITLLIAVFGAIYFTQSKAPALRDSRSSLFSTKKDVLLAFLPTLFVLMSIMGAIRLNNGNGNEITFWMLVGLAVYCIILIRAGNDKKVLGKNVIPTALFFISLSLLFMTSLRGWHITGHDIQHEYHVFQLTKNSGLWLISNFRDAYNACLSITILPAIFSNLLNVPDQYVYKIFFQIIFASVPSVIYMTLRRYFSTAIALLSVLYFVSFPTFFGDMSMLNRQEIAFLFLALMVYCIFNVKIPFYLRRGLFLCFGIGMVLSHYSTTYTVIALLFFLLVTRPIVRLIAKKLGMRPQLKNFAIEGFGTAINSLSKPLITLWMVIILAGASFLWSSVLTDTSSGSFTRVIKETLSVMRNNVKDDSRSGDVLYNLFSWKKLDTGEIIKNYQEKAVMELRKNAPLGTYYDSSLYEMYKILPANDAEMPLTAYGRSLSSLGINVPAFNYVIRQTSAKILQILIVIGFIFIILRGAFCEKTLPVELMIFAAGSLLMIVSQVLLPVLSAEYGILRTFQQSLMFLGVFVVVGNLAIFIKFKEKRRVLFAGLCVVFFLFSTTGIITQTLGGYPAQLHLNNGGNYYNLYYIHDSDVQGAQWLKQEILKTYKAETGSVDIQTDLYDFDGLRSIPRASISKGIYPGLVRKDSYVFLGYANTQKSQASIYWNGDAIVYSYPIKFLDDNKNLEYNNGKVKIYR